MKLNNIEKKVMRMKLIFIKNTVIDQQPSLIT